MNCSLTAKFQKKEEGGEKTSILASVKGIRDYPDETAIMRKNINSGVTWERRMSEA